MENPNLLELDAVPTSSAVANSGALDVNALVNQTLNQNMVFQQRNATANFTINNSSGISFGTLIEISGNQMEHQAPHGNNFQPPARHGPNRLAIERTIYRKTPTIKAMMESEDVAGPSFLDLVAGNLGRRWKDFTVLIEPNIMFTERMEVDYFDRGGTKEVRTSALLLSSEL